MSVLLGNGDGTFRPRADFTTGNAPYSVAVVLVVAGDDAAAGIAVLLTATDRVEDALAGERVGTWFQPDAAHAPQEQAAF